MRIPPESLAAYQRRMPSVPGRPVKIVPVAVVLMNRLPSPQASAVVLRRRVEWPHNVIVLREDSLTMGKFGAAIAALSAELRRRGETPSENVTLQIHGDSSPPQLQNPTMRALAAWELDTLRRVPRATVQGIGAQRAILIHVGIPTPP